MPGGSVIETKNPPSGRVVAVSGMKRSIAPRQVSSRGA